MNAIQIVGLVASALPKLYEVIAGAIADRKRAAEDVRADAYRAIDGLIAEVIALRATVTADDAAAIAEALDGVAPRITTRPGV